MSINLSSEIIKAKNAIELADNILLTCHVHPDGDALGSVLAMAHALKKINKNIYATFPQPFEIASNIKESLPGIELLISPDRLDNIKFNVAMTFDCGSISRIEGLNDLLKSADTLINVDHHMSNENFGDINVIDISAPSSGTVVLEIIDSLEIELDKNIAQCAYVALLTDTGRFQFSSTNKQVFDQASRLSQYDLPIAFLSRKLTEEDSYSFLKFCGEILTKMQMVEDLSFVYAIAPIALREKYDLAYTDLEGLIEFVRRTKEANVACVIKEFMPGEYRVSLRSLGKIDVCAIASSFEGGGHKFAAGFSSSQKPDDIIQSLKVEILKQSQGN